jgi:hypothetical protein
MRMIRFLKGLPETGRQPVPKGAMSLHRIDGHARERAIAQLLPIGMCHGTVVADYAKSADAVTCFPDV